MLKPDGLHWYILQAIAKAQGETSDFVADATVAETTKIELASIRFSCEILENGGWVDVIRSNLALQASLNANGRLCLRQYASYPPGKSPASTFVTDTNSKPSLAIEFDESKDCIVHSKLEFKDGRGAVERTHVRMHISTDGGQIARGCRVVLEHIAEISMHGALPIQYLTPMRLLWSKEFGGENSLGRDIYPSSHSVVDLLYTDSDDTNRWFVLRDIGHTGGGLLAFNKRYRFWITATAEDRDSAEIVLDVACGPNRSDVRVFEPRTLVIRSHPKIN